jgi:putative N6-adenine-specific DNA methylase
MKIIAKTLFGLEEILEKELIEFGAKETNILNRAVEFQGDQALLYRANLCCRLALRFLVVVDSFQAHNERHLYGKIQHMDWSKYISGKQTFAIDCTAYGERFRHSKYAALIVKDAIVDQFREKTGRRPSIDTSEPDVKINVHISDIHVDVSLDSSGDSLEKRGYRLEAMEAPISEVLAAAMITSSGWNRRTPLFDPMCGSGTIVIEAAMMAANKAPGLDRSFGFERWSDFNAELLENLKQELVQNETKPQVEILGRDRHRRAMVIAERNARRAGVDRYVTIEAGDFMKKEPPFEQGWIIMNPPYGERLNEDDEMEAFYHEVGFKLKHEFAGYTAWIISSNNKALKRIGLKPDTRIQLYNGALECRYNGYTLFAGKRQDQINRD